jgi:hypothetical protein
MTQAPNPALAHCVCPVCAKGLTGATAVPCDGTRRREIARQPKRGMVSMCMYCRSFLRFVGRNQQLRVRLLSEEEIGALPDPVRNMLLRSRIVIKAKWPEGFRAAPQPHASMAHSTFSTESKDPGVR